jgi:hypothetical protein
VEEPPKLCDGTSGAGQQKLNRVSSGIFRSVRTTRPRPLAPSDYTLSNERKAIATVRIPVYDDSGKNVNNFWISLYNSSSLGDYIYVSETVFDGKRWTPKGAMILPIDMTTDYVFNLLKVAIRSGEFREHNPELVQRIEDFTKGLALDVGLR